MESYLTSYQPHVTVTSSHYTIGRCALSCTSTVTQPPPLFAHTRHSLVLLEKLACCVKHDEPLLLTGETGEWELEIK